MTTTATPASIPAQVSPKQQFLDMYNMECATTLKLLREFPADQADFRPHPRSVSAKELAHVFSVESSAGCGALEGAVDFSKFPATPDTIADTITRFEAARDTLVSAVTATPEQELFNTITVPVGKGQLGDVPKIQFLWMLLCDQIHHRGQFSVYTRMAGGKVPSIYGPSADEPWS
jgi:uncharacterized damage-inducible protein DinB